MKMLMENLMALQKIEWNGGQLSVEQKQRVFDLRAKIPSQVLDHYDRLMARGKKGVSIVRNRVCGECHISVPIGMLGALTFGSDIQLCDSCGRYLYLPEEEPVCPGVANTLSGSPGKIAKRKRKATADVSR